MEASEKPQLPLDGDAQASVRAIDDRLVIQNLNVDDARTARVVRERAEANQSPAETVRDAIEIGARVLDREGLEADVDYVRAAFEQAAGELHREWGEQARTVVDTVQAELERVLAGEGSVLDRTLGGFGDELAEQIAEHFDGERATAVQNQVKDTVGKLVEERMQALIRHLSSDDGANPLADFKAGVQTTIVEAVRKLQLEESTTREKLENVQQAVTRLTEQAEARKQLAEAEEAGTRKGRTFEDCIHMALEKIAAGRGDVAHHVGDERGEGGSKRGDTVVELEAASGTALGRLVFEAKDERLSKNEAWKQLNAAMSERDAAFGVLVVPGEDHIPAGREQLIEYEGNKLIVAVDRERPEEPALQVAYRYARLRVLFQREARLGVDAGAVRDSAEAARSALKRLQSVRLALTNIDKSSTKAREGLDEIVSDVDGELARIESIVAAVDDDRSD